MDLEIACVFFELCYFAFISNLFLIEFIAQIHDVSVNGIDTFTISITAIVDACFYVEKKYTFISSRFMNRNKSLINEITINQFQCICWKLVRT